MAQNLVGIDVGRDNVKICCRDHGTRFIVRRLPENIMGKDGSDLTQYHVYSYYGDDGSSSDDDLGDAQSA